MGITANQRETIAAIDVLSGHPFYVEGDSATGAVYVTLKGTSQVTIAGNKTNNNAAPGATNIGTLPAIATAAAPSYTEGNQVGLSTDLSGALRVSGSISVGGTTDNSAFTAGSSQGTPAMGFYHSTIDSVTDGRAAAVAITPKRAMMVNLQTAAGVEITNTSNALDINIKSGNLTTLPVTNAGTFAVQEATLDAALIAQEATTSGLKGITAFGAVTTNAPTYTTLKSDALSLDTSGLLRVSLKDTPANTNKLLVTPDSVALPANQSVNISQINAATPLMGNGITGTGSLRVTIASDNTAFAVNSTLSAETTKVIGVTRTADGAGNLLTSNSTTYTAKFGLDGNLLGTLGTAFSTAGKVDVKGADGDVFVRQATGTNLHTVLDSGTLTSITNSVTVTATNLSTNVAQINGVTPLMGNGVSGTGALRVSVASDSTGQIAPAANATATGSSIYNNTALSSTKQAVNAAAGNLYGYHIYNPNGAVIYIQLFNVASASVTVGSTAPTAVIAIPSLGWADSDYAVPITFGTALTIAATTTSTGSGAPTSALLCNIWYK